MSIRARLSTTYVLISVIPIFFVSYLHFNNSRETIVTAKLGELGSVADLKVTLISNFFNDLRRDVAVSQDYYNIRHNLPILAKHIGDADSSAFKAATAMLDTQLLARTKELGAIDDLMLLVPDGRVVYRAADVSQQEKFGQLRYDAGSAAFIGGKSDMFIGDIFMLTGADQDYGFYITAPVKDELGNFAGEIAIVVNIRKLLALAINKISGLGETGEVEIGAHVSERVADPRKYEILFSSTRSVADPMALRKVFLESAVGISSANTYGGGNGSGQTVDYRGNDVLAAWRHDPVLNLELAVKIDLDEALIPARALAVAAWFLGIIAALLALLISLIFSRLITEPIVKLAGTARRLSEGDFEFSVPKDLILVSDETGALARAFNVMQAHLRELYKGLEQKVREKTSELAKSLQNVESQNKKLEESERALVNVVEDLKIEKTLSEHTANELQKFRLAVEGASDHIIMTDTDGFIIYANKAAEKNTGYSRGEILGKRPSLWGGIMPKEFYAKMWETIKIKKQPFEGEVNNKRKNGEPYTAAVSIVPLVDIKGNILFFVGIERDITKEKELDRAKSEFISLASHQLRTPLTTMKWIPEMLLDGAFGKLSVKQRKYVEDIHYSAGRLVILVNQLLSISRIEARRLGIEVEDVDLRRLFDDVKSEFAHAAQQHKHKLTFSISADTATIRTDGRLLGEILRNLIANAIKYTPNGGRIAARVALGKGGKIEFAVEDSGVGIPENQQSRMFEKFFRATNVLALDVSGTGLGLYIVRKMARELGGDITFVSEENKGTTFTVTLPVGGPPFDGDRK